MNRRKIVGGFIAAVAVSLVVVLAWWLTPKPWFPQPTVGLARVVRGHFTVASNGREEQVLAPIRVERGAQVTAGADGRGAVTLDSGGWLLFDRGAVATLTLADATLTHGRIWVDASNADATTLKTPHGSITAESATFAASLTDSGTDVYCASGELTYHGEHGEGRVEQGETLHLAATGAPRVSGEDLWDDWTGGLADPAPRHAPATGAIGVLAGRRLDELGIARTALPVRAHEVHVDIRGELAETTITQTFFNARSDILEGEWRVRIPHHAIVEGFSVDTGNGFADGVISAFATDGSYGLVFCDPTTERASLAYDGPDRLRARVYPVQPGATVRVKLVYTEWLTRRADVRTYVYPMQQEGEPPLLGEMVLDVDVHGARAKAYRAGMGAEVQGSHVRLRRSDFRPRADFYLDLVDAEPPKADLASAWVVPPLDAREEGEYDYALFDVPTQALEESEQESARAPLSLAIVVDASGAIEDEDLELARGVVEAVLRQLTPTDEVVLRIADVGTRTPEGAPARLQPATRATAEAILGALATTDLGGATDLGRDLREAAGLVAGKPRGAVLYLGDGIPTTGAMDRSAIRTALATLDAPPRFFALGIGDGANVDLLRGLFGDGAVPVRERTEAAHAVMSVLAEAARPMLRGVRVDLGENVERTFPSGAITIEAGEHVRFVARLHDHLPETISMSGTRDGHPFRQDLRVHRETSEDGGDVRRRWATMRLDELLDADEGREALVELGTRYSVVTPWTALVVGGVAKSVVYPVRGFDADPLEVAYDLGGGGAAIAASNFGGESTRGWRRRARQVAAASDIAASPESTWVDRVGPETIGVGGNIGPIPTAGHTAAAPVGDGGLGQAAVQRVLAGGGRGPQGCYDRRLVVRPDLSGQITVSVSVDGTGAVKDATGGYDSIGDVDLRACVLAEIRGLRFPATGGSTIISASYTYVLETPSRQMGARRQCSDASRQELSVRDGLWRERLAANAGVSGALSVWREALASCELATWRDRRTLLDRMLHGVGGIAQQVQLYAALAGDPAVASYLRRAIQRNVRTPWDVELVRRGMGLEVPVDWSFFARLWRAQPTPALRLALTRKWLSVAPDEMDLRLRLLALLEETHAIPEAKRVARELRADPLADAKVRTEVGEFWLRQHDEAEARRIFSEIVERAPLDPWARQRLGDVERAHGWADDAYQEYEMLARLLPDDARVMLLMARAAADAGRLDEALRLEERLAESVDPGLDTGAAAYARLWTLVRLARLRAHTTDAATLSQIRERERGAGALRDPPDLLVAIVWDHPDDEPALWGRTPSTAPETTQGTATSSLGFERAALLGDAFGIEAIAIREKDDGTYTFEVRRDERDALRDLHATLVAITAAGAEGEHVTEQDIVLTRDHRVVRFDLAPDGSLRSVAVPPASPPH